MKYLKLTERKNAEAQDYDITSLYLRTRRLERCLRLSACGWLLVIGLVVISQWTQPTNAQKSAEPTSLRVSELVVVDPKGVERVRIGGELPDSIVNGKRIGRGGEKIAGILLYDGTGQERSGYVTFEPSGNVGLTLDTRNQQVAYFLAGSDGASALQMWNGNKSLMELRSDSDGSRFSAVKDGQLIFQEPEVKSISTNICKEYQDARARVSKEQVMSDCRKRYKQDACQACLGKP